MIPKTTPPPSIFFHFFHFFYLLCKRPIPPSRSHPLEVTLSKPPARSHEEETLCESQVHMRATEKALGSPLDELGESTMEDEASKRLLDQPRPSSCSSSAGKNW